MAKAPRSLPDSHVFDDGQTLLNVRDAMVAAAKTGMWHICFEMAHRYKIEKIFCMGCARPLKQADGTYMQRGGFAIRICLHCHRDLIR